MTPIGSASPTASPQRCCDAAPPRPGSAWFTVRHPVVPLQAHCFLAVTDPTLLDSELVAIPGWVHDRDALARLLAAKRHDDIGARVWRHILDAARLVTTLPSMHDPLDGAGRTRLVAARRHVLAAAARMPVPWATALDRPQAARQLGLDFGADPPESPWRGAVDDVATRLCAALADPEWVDPLAVAGHVADLAVALEDYAATARHLDATRATQSSARLRLVATNSDP